MTQPQYAQPQMPGYPPQTAAPQYPQQPQGYPMQQPGYPTAPPQGYGPPQGYPQAQPGYAQPQQPAQQLAAGTLDAFYSQPSVGGGAALKFEVNTTHVGMVSREITHADVQQQTNPQNGQPAFFKDGRPKFVMKVPLTVQPTADRPDGLAQWYVAGAARDELARAMKAAGAPDGPPEVGALIQVTCTGTRPSGAGMSPSKVYQVVYQRPQGAGPAQQAPQAPAAPSVDQQPQWQPAGPEDRPMPQQQMPQPPAPPQQAMPPAPPVPQQQAQPPAPPAQPAPQAATPGLPPLGPDNAALLAQLTGQQLPAAPVAGS